MKINIGHTESHHRALTDLAEPKTPQAIVVEMHVVWKGARVTVCCVLKLPYRSNTGEAANTLLCRIDVVSVNALMAYWLATQKDTRNFVLIVK